MGSAGYDGPSDRKTQSSLYEMSKQTSGKDWPRGKKDTKARSHLGRRGVHLGREAGMVSSRLNEAQSWGMEITCLQAFESQESKGQATLFSLFM